MPLRRLALILGVATACGKADSARNTNDASTSGAAQDSTAAIAVSGEWPPDLGAALLIPSDTENVAVVLYPAMPNTPMDP